MAPLTIAYFVSPHGFGHAARTCAVLERLVLLRPDLTTHLYTQVPSWFFSASPIGHFEYHELRCDLGLVQRSPLEEDLEATVAALSEMLPFDARVLDSLAESVVRSGCQLVCSDIAPLGLAVARHAGLRSLLIENFTWDWIYEGYLPQAPALAPFIEYLRAEFASADLHVQCEPVCVPREHPTLRSAPIARQPRAAEGVVRARLNISDDTPLVLVTLGGTPGGLEEIRGFDRRPDWRFVLVGAPESQEEGNVTWLARDTDLFHPDLIAAADVAVAKLGYSTVAELYQSGTALLYLRRPDFRESAVIEAFVTRSLLAAPCSSDALQDGSWIDSVGTLLDQPRRAAPHGSGATQVAELISAQLR